MPRSGSQVSQKWPISAPKWLPSIPKVPSTVLKWPLSGPKWLQSGPKSLTSPPKWPPSDPKSIPKWLQFDILKHKNVRIPSHRASQKLSRRSFGSKLNFVVSILYFYMDFHVFPWISMDSNTKTAEYRATRHEIKNFLYQTIDLFKPRRLKYARESETAK